MTQPPVGPVSGWPPRGEPVPWEAGLPSADGVALSRFTAGRAGVLVGLPSLFFMTYLRLVRSGIPMSRLVNPGTLAVLTLTTLAVAVVALRKIGRVMVAGGSGWVARRGLLAREWVVIPFEHVRFFSSRLYRRRGGAVVVVTVATDDGRRVRVSVPATSPAAEALPTALRTLAAQEPSNLLRRMSRAAVLGWLVVILAAALLPMAYFAVGPLRLLPPPIAGQFTWSGCRAVLTAERDVPPLRRTTFLQARLVANGTAWHLQGGPVLTPAQYAAHTERPDDRLRNLTRDGLRSISLNYYQGPDGETAGVTMLRFATSAGALAYDRHVNRAVCETKFGAHGPQPTEVRLFRGGVQAVRWVEADTIIEVNQTSSRPFVPLKELTTLAGAITSEPPRG